MQKTDLVSFVLVLLFIFVTIGFTIWNDRRMEQHIKELDAMLFPTIQSIKSMELDKKILDTIDKDGDVFPFMQCKIDARLGENEGSKIYMPNVFPSGTHVLIEGVNCIYTVDSTKKDIEVGNLLVYLPTQEEVDKIDKQYRKIYILRWGE